MTDNQVLVNQVVERASTRFEEKYNCSMAVLAGCVEVLGVAPPETVNVAAGFGGGFGRSGCACGALTGGIMALGLKYGSGDPDAKAAMYEKVRSLYADFTKQFGSPCCKQLNGDDFTSVEHRVRCTAFVRESAAAAAKIITS